MIENDYTDIRPYSDAEAEKALGRVSRHPMIPSISKYLFPDAPANTLRRRLRQITSVDQFQDEIMYAVVEAVIAKTSSGVTWDGVEYLKSLGDKKFLIISNHRDIVLDPALIQYMLKQNGLSTTEICVGSNLLGSKLVEDLMRSNRMIKVIRGIGARELYQSSQRLSHYIRESICSGRSRMASACSASGLPSSCSRSRRLRWLSVMAVSISEKKPLMLSRSKSKRNNKPAWELSNEKYTSFFTMQIQIRITR